MRGLSAVTRPEYAPRTVRAVLVLAALAGILSGCGLPGAGAAPTPYPPEYLPTVIYLTALSIDGTIAAQTAQADTPTPVPSSTPSPAPPTPDPTATATAAPGIPPAQIQIQAPGPMSRVGSPLQLKMTIVAGKSNAIQVNLYGEDGRLLAAQLMRVFSRPAGEFLFVKIPFQIRAAAEVGILQVSTKDERGRVQSLNTLRVLLLSSGTSEITPAGNNIYERCVLYGLQPGASISGGVLPVAGKFLPYNDQPLILELIAADGTSLGLRVLTFSGLDPQDFSTTVPYKVTAATQARLFVRQADEVLRGPGYIYSQELTLNP